MAGTLITKSFLIAFCLPSILSAGGAEPSRITSWSNTSTGNAKTVFQVKPGEKITFTVKAEGAEKYVWLVDKVGQKDATGASFEWTVPNKKGLWKILVKTTNKARRQWVKQQAAFWDKWVEVPKDRRGKTHPEKKEAFIQGMTEHRLYPLKSQKEWIVSTGDKGTLKILKSRNEGKATDASRIGPPSTTGWESEKSLAEDIHRPLGRGPFDTMFSLAFDVMGDGKWTLIAGECYGKFLGYYWDGNKWVSDRSRIKGLEDIGRGSAPALIPNLTGDKKWTLIARSGGGKFFGWCWDRTKWVSDPARVKGLTVSGSPGRSGIAVLKNLKGESKWTLISGSRGGAFQGFYWNGAEWVSDPTRIEGLDRTGSRPRPAAGLDVFGDKKWTLIIGVNTAFTGYRWDGKKWVRDPSRAKGLGHATNRDGDASAALAYNLRGDGKWVLIAGYGVGSRGFFCNKVSKNEIPLIKDISSISTATAARIRWEYDRTWNHRVRYSARKDMSGAVWSDLQEDIGSPDIRLRHLKPDTTYYYEAHTYTPWDTKTYVRSSIGSFTTPPARGYIRLKPGESIQDAINSLEPAGGIVELLDGTHDVHDTIIIDRSNVVIYGTHRAIVRHCNKYAPCFHIPDLEDVDPDLYVENITFRGFTTASTHKNRRGASMIRATHVRNLTIEDIHDKSWGGSFTGIGASQEHRRWSENVFIRNNLFEHRSIFITHIRNIHVVNNIIMDGRLGNDQAMSYVYTIGNRINTHNRHRALLSDNHTYSAVWDNFVQGGTAGGIRISSGNHILVENNTVTGAGGRRAWGGNIVLLYDFPRKVLIRNNHLYNAVSDGIQVTSYYTPRRGADIRIVNNTIYNSGRDGIRILKDCPSLDVSNNIIANSKGYGINRTAGKISLGHNCIWNSTRGNYNGCTAGAGDFSKDPLFSNPANNDFHLKSKAGRWDPKAGKWVKDAVQSPCIDAGDPKANGSHEPAPNGGRVNIGACGNTGEASKSVVRRKSKDKP